MKNFKQGEKVINLTKRKKAFFVSLFLLLGIILIPLRFTQGAELKGAESKKSESKSALPSDVPPGDEVVKRIPSLEMYPCNECHEGPADYNSRKRELTKEHNDLVSHPTKRKEDPTYSCQSCHQEGRYDRLRLSSGEDISLNESYRLCGQCHGTQLEDWQKHIHGLRTGLWNGAGKIESCTSCHPAHSPQFKPIKPFPPPLKPKR